ncbi:MAG: hypothetical protein IKI75_01395 [Lachnospiraceae bacterium]|nr:hypothetical protein [Lachnospiraceae bacterium]
MKAYDGVVNSGDHGLLKKAMEKAERGEKLCLGFLGGSITEGYSSTKHEYCYAKRIHTWWCGQFPKAETRYVNAGIGGTGSDYGVARLGELLAEKPDVIFVDFSVNDANADLCEETYEGLIRGCLKAENEPAVVLIHFIKYDDAATAEPIHLRLGLHYGLPCISIGASVYQRIQDGELDVSEVTEDMLHPTDNGHRLIAELVTDFLYKVRQENALYSSKLLPRPLTVNAYEKTVRLQHANCDAVLRGFEKDTKDKEYPADHFRGGWVGYKAGDEISIRFRGSELAVQFRRTVKRPAPVALAIVDGDEENAVLLDANFDQDWGDCLSIVTVMRHGHLLPDQVRIGASPANYYEGYGALAAYRDVYPEVKDHELTIRILGDPESLGWEQLKTSTGGPAWIKSGSSEGAATFDLLGVIVAEPPADDLPLLPMKLEPALMERIWGGTKLKDVWGYEEAGSGKYGECWAVACNEQADNRVASGYYAGKRISELVKEGVISWKGENFPLLVKIIDAGADLSIQVHPDDVYAREHGESNGKRECWYILDCPEGAELIIGNKAADKDELKKLVEEKRWDELLNRVPVKKGDFIQIDPGTLHSITGGITLLEVQQNCDITYRVYDFDRLQNGKPRELHVKESLEVINTPDRKGPEDVLHEEGRLNEAELLAETPDYKVWTIRVQGTAEPECPPEAFLVASVIEGSGSLEDMQLKKGDHLIIPAGFGKMLLKGDMRVNLAMPVERRS